jgi:hypothetical protein
MPCLLVHTAGCFSSGKEVKNMKDLAENMLDLRIYHENLAGALLEKNKDYAEWFVYDMDSIMQLMARKFTEHRKLPEPFSNYYKKRLQPYFSNLKKAIKKEDWPQAVKAYSTLTRKCNSCHIELDVEKEVIDYSRR